DLGRGGGGATRAGDRPRSRAERCAVAGECARMTTLAMVAREVVALRRQVATVCPPALPVLPASPLALAVAVGVVLDDWQAAAATSRAPRALWKVARQCGKTALAALLA